MMRIPFFQEKDLNISYFKAYCTILCYAMNDITLFEHDESTTLLHGGLLTYTYKYFVP